MVIIGMLTRWERKVPLDKLHGLEVSPDHIRVVKHRVKKRLIEAFRDVHIDLCCLSRSSECYRCNRHQGGAGGGI